jgi:tetratricopeptide (TPR) repeat protein
MGTNQSVPIDKKFKLAASSGAVAPPVAAPSKQVPPLFRKIDWLTLLITLAVVWTGYLLTLSPEVTLQDSGELAVGSFYAGIPHPPGYPVWTMYTWLWTELLPWGNIAWRVAVAESFAGALACALLGFLVSRGSSMLIEGIEDLEGIVGQWENAICMVSGFVAGTLMGFNGFVWSQAVIVEVYLFSVLSFVCVLLCLLRWIYAPHQRRYLYLALFLFGICITNHQTLVVAAMGLEVAIAAADFKLGRNLFQWNSLIYGAGLILKQQGMLTMLDANPAVFVIFNVVGIASIAAYVWFAILTKETIAEFGRDALLTAFVLLLAALPTSGLLCGLLALAALAALVRQGWATRQIGTEWLVVFGCGLCFVCGAAFYLYMPLAGMTNPPMQWGYPRTVEGFFHALTRGQYEKTNPSDIIGDPGRFFGQLHMLLQGVVEEFNPVYACLALVPFLFFFKLHRRERAWLIGITAIYLCLGVLLLILLNPSPDRATRDLVKVFFTGSHTLVALLIGYGLTLVAAYMANHYQRFRRRGVIGGGIAAALALYCFVDITQTTYFGKAASVTSAELFTLVGQCFTNPNQFGWPVFGGLILIGLTGLFVVALALYRTRAPLAISLAIFTLMPLHPILCHWYDNEQKGHWFGYWFGHDMFSPQLTGSDGKQIYSEMAKDAVLFGGTDPGRFCPTYMIFAESFTPHDCQPELDKKFDRRDVYIITQNALADGTYLNYIRAHYNKSEQVKYDSLFFSELVRSQAERAGGFQTNLLARALLPLDTYFTDLGNRIEKRRRAGSSFFQPADFQQCEAFARRLREGGAPAELSRYLVANLTPGTQALLKSGPTGEPLRKALAKDLTALLQRELQVKQAIADKVAAKDAIELAITLSGASDRQRAKLETLTKELAELKQIGPLYTPERFRGVELTDYLRQFIEQNPQSWTRIRLNRLLLEAAYPAEIAKSIGGLYPDREIYIPTPEDSQRCFQEYLKDAEKRAAHDNNPQLRNEPRQLKPGEDVHIVNEGGAQRVQVSGQVAVMAINGLLTKVIFDHNPLNEFYVEESFPLDWMYPYLTPHGDIMKINRQPLAELTPDIVRRDHEYWKQFAKRGPGDFIDYDTPVSNIVAFIEKTYIKKDFSGFTGDRRFVRDNDAQKAFSKLRSSIGGLYAWRINAARTEAERQRMLKEADFTFKQAFAFCPYSPEAVFRYVQLLATSGRIEDAVLIAQTCQKLDPYNEQVKGLVRNLTDARGQQSAIHQAQSGLKQMEAEWRAAPTNLQTGFTLAQTYLSMQQTNLAIQVLDQVVANPKVAPGTVLTIASLYSQIGRPDKLQTMLPLFDRIVADPKPEVNAVLAVARLMAEMGRVDKLEPTLEKLVQTAPDQPEGWYDLAALKTTLNKQPAAITALAKALELSAKRLATNAKAKDLRGELEKDPRFVQLRAMPEFKQLAAPK